jgi:phage terminase large subunit-like protein
MRERSSDQPGILITTKPRPISLLMRIEKLPATVVVTGSSYENARNLDPRWFDDVLSRYEGTRLGRQEIMAEILTDAPGALRTLAMLDNCQVRLDGEIEVRKTTMEPPASELPSVIGIWTG